MPKTRKQIKSKALRQKKRKKRVMTQEAARIRREHQEWLTNRDRTRAYTSRFNNPITPKIDWKKEGF